MSKGTCAWPVYQGFPYLRSLSTSFSGATIAKPASMRTRITASTWSALAKLPENTESSVHAYALMTNHVHLLMTPISTAGTSRVMQTLGRRYVQYINHTYRRSGTLWGGSVSRELGTGRPIYPHLLPLHRTQPP